MSLCAIVCFTVVCFFRYAMEGENSKIYAKTPGWNRFTCIRAFGCFAVPVHGPAPVRFQDPLMVPYKYPWA